MTVELATYCLLPIAVTKGLSNQGNLLIFEFHHTSSVFLLNLEGGGGHPTVSLQAKSPRCNDWGMVTVSDQVQSRPRPQCTRHDLHELCMRVARLD